MTSAERDHPNLQTSYAGSSRADAVACGPAARMALAKRTGMAKASSTIAVCWLGRSCLTEHAVAVNRLHTCFEASMICVPGG